MKSKQKCGDCVFSIVIPTVGRVEALRECSRWAEEYGVTLALQNHPPVLRLGYEDALQMVREVNTDNLKLCLDAPLLGKQDDEYVEWLRCEKKPSQLLHV